MLFLWRAFLLSARAYRSRSLSLARLWHTHAHSRSSLVVWCLTCFVPLLARYSRARTPSPSTPTSVWHGSAFLRYDTAKQTSRRLARCRHRHRHRRSHLHAEYLAHKLGQQHECSTYPESTYRCHSRVASCPSRSGPQVLTTASEACVSCTANEGDCTRTYARLPCERHRRETLNGDARLEMQLVRSHELLLGRRLDLKDQQLLHQLLSRSDASCHTLLSASIAHARAIALSKIAKRKQPLVCRGVGVVLPDR